MQSGGESTAWCGFVYFFYKFIFSWVLNREVNIFELHDTTDFKYFLHIHIFSLPFSLKQQNGRVGKLTAELNAIEESAKIGSVYLVYEYQFEVSLINEMFKNINNNLKAVTFLNSYLTVSVDFNESNIFSSYLSATC